MTDQILFSELFAEEVNAASPNVDRPNTLAQIWGAERVLVDGISRSVDPSEIWTFKDGSQCQVDNPRQECFDISATPF